MSRRIYLLAFLVLVLLGARSVSACVSMGSSGGGSNVPIVRLNIPPGVPGYVSQGINQGKNQWNNTGCNIGGDDYPLFVTAGAGHPTIDIVYSPGFGEGSNESSCGVFDHGTNEILLFGMFKPGDGRILNCPDTAGSVSDLVAHELGHYLGLGESGCEDHIMGPQGWTEVAGSAIWFSDREVQPMECGMADFLNTPPQEEQNECNQLKIDPCSDDGEGTPIIVDLDFDNFHLTGIEDSVYFDIDADGTPDQISWTSAETLDGFLALDRNRNGIIDDGRELFGNATRLMTGARAPHGFSALAELDSWRVGGNENGVVEPGDPLFSALRIWIDWNHNGFSEESELFRLEDIGLVALELDFRESPRIDQHGNQFKYVSLGWIEGNPSQDRRVKVVDVIFVEAE